MESIVTNLDLFVILKKSNEKNDYIFLFHTVLSQLNLSLPEEDLVTFKEFCRRFTRAIEKRWRLVNCKTEIFRKTYASWLEKKIDWPSCIKENFHEASTSLIHTKDLPSTSSIQPSPSVGTMTKRKFPRKPFEDLGTKQKKKRSDHLMDTDSSELVCATISKLKEEGQGNIASVIEHMLKHPEAINKIQDAIKRTSGKEAFTPMKALGLLLSLNLSKWQYITLRESAIREGIKNVYPSYYAVQQAKTECYPPETAIYVTDISAKISLQALLDHTTKRILKSLPERLRDMELVLISKWGFDGASSQSKYKQKMESASTSDDSSIFMTSLSPLKMSCNGKTVWENPKPNSASFCRPVQFTFVKESETVVKEEEKRMQEEILALRSTDCDSNIVNHKLMMTMVDAKICTYLSEAKSNAACYICLAKPSELNNLKALGKKVISTDMLEFGVSSLHARINMMECLLHISFRLDIKQWAVKGKSDKDARDARKKIIQDRFKSEVGLLVDMVKQGHGTTNDGNTARRFFENPDKTAAITGLNKELIYRFAVILQTISSGECIDVDKFRDYAYKTAEMYVDLYSWYYMSATVHKILLHGAEIISSNSIVPIGSLSEEASEARNKDFRRFREHHSRKISRVSSNKDIFNFLLLSSDPLVSTERPSLDAKKRKEFFSETYSLLKLQEPEFDFQDVSQLDSDSELDSGDSDVE